MVCIRSIIITLTVYFSLFFGPGFLWAEKSVTNPRETLNKGEKFIIKGREYCYECIDNSECLGCHTQVSERKFAQSVHGANSCNSCHWDITDVKEHLKAKGSRIHAELVTCHRCHKKEGAEHYASAHFINDVQCRDCHINIHEMTYWRGDKTRVIEKCTICHADDGYSESVHGKSVLAGNPDSATCSDCHGLHKIPILKGDEPEVVQFRKEFHTEVCQKCHADREMMEPNNEITGSTLAGEIIMAKLTEAPGNNAPFGGIKVVTPNGWFAVRPSGTEDVYKFYAESLKGKEHLTQIQEEAREIIETFFRSAGVYSTK